MSLSVAGFLAAKWLSLSVMMKWVQQQLVKTARGNLKLTLRMPVSITSVVAVWGLMARS